MATPALTDQAVDDDIAADWKAISAKHTEDEPAALVPEPEAAEPATEPEQAEVTESDRPRDEAGRFQKADSPAEPARPTLHLPKEAPASEPAERPARDVARAPSTWKPLARAEWDKLPPTIREEIHRREGDYMHGQQQLLPDARLGSEIRKTIEPYRSILEAEGVDAAAAVSDLLRVNNILRNGSAEVKLGAFRQMAQKFGIDLRGIQAPSGQSPEAQQPGSPAQPAFRDPRVDELLQQRELEHQQRQQQDEQSRTQAAQQWMNEADAQGNPVRPYVNDVMLEMRALVPQILQTEPGLSHAEALQRAYDRATWAHPEIRQILLRQQQDQQRRTTESQTRIAEAKRSISGNVPRRASVPSPAKPGNMTDTIAETARELGLIG